MLRSWGKKGFPRYWAHECEPISETHSYTTYIYTECIGVRRVEWGWRRLTFFLLQKWRGCARLWCDATLQNKGRRRFLPVPLWSISARLSTPLQHLICILVRPSYIEVNRLHATDPLTVFKVVIKILRVGRSSSSRHPYIACVWFGTLLYLCRRLHVYVRYIL